MDRTMIARSKEDVIDLSIDDDEDSYVIGGECDGIAVISLDDSDEVSEWDASIRKTLMHISVDLSDEFILHHFMNRYLKQVKYIAACYEDSDDLRRMVQGHIESLYSILMQTECRYESKYLEIMEEILAEYVKLELNVIRKVVKISKKLIITAAQRIVRILSVALLNQNSHMLHVLIKQSDNYNASASCSEVLCLIYRHYLIDQLPQDKTDEAFCRRYIVFQKWKFFQRDSVWIEMDRLVYKQCNRRPESIETNDVLRPILMPSGDSTVDIVQFCYNGLYQIANRYFKHLSGKKEQVCETEFEVDLSNFMFQDDEIAVISDHNSEDVELSKACESFLNGLSLAGKASTSSTDYERNQRCKEESSEIEEEEEEEEEEVSSSLLDKDVFSLGDLNVSLPEVGSATKEIEKTHRATTVSEETRSKPTISEETTHPEPTVSKEIRPILPEVGSATKEIEKTHPATTVSEETRSKPTISEETTLPEPTVSKEIRPESMVSEDIHSGPTGSEDTHPEVMEETHSELEVIVSEETLSIATHTEAIVSAASVEEIAKVSAVVSPKDPVFVGVVETPTANRMASYESEPALNSTNVEIVDMELCSDEVVEQCRSPDCPELIPEVPISVTCPRLISEVVGSTSTSKPPTLVSSVKKYSYNYGQITPPSDVSSDDHNGDKVVVYPKPVQLPSKSDFRVSQVNGVRHRTETKTRECNTSLSTHEHIPTEVLPPRDSPVQSHSVISSVKKRNQDHRTKKVRGRCASGLAVAPDAAAKVATEKVIDNLSVEATKTIDTGQIRVLPVNTMQSPCNSIAKITENTFSLEGFTRFEQLQNEIMNGPVSKATPVKPALTADENRDFERDIFSSKVTLVQRPLQAEPPISYDESSSRSNSPSVSPSPAYEVIEKDDCKDHFANSFKDANGANGSRALVQRVIRPRTPKSILKKDSRAAFRKKKRTDHIKFNEYAKISFYNAMGEDNNAHKSITHSKYLQQVLREEAVVLPGDMRPSMMADPKLNEEPKVVLKTNVKRKINEYTKSDQFLTRYGQTPQPNASGSRIVRVDYDKSDGSLKPNDKDLVYRRSTPAAVIDYEKTFGFRLTQSGWVMYLKNRDYVEKKPKKRKNEPLNHVTGDTVIPEKRKRVCRTPEEKLDDTTKPIQKRKGRPPKASRKFSPDDDDDESAENDFDKLLNSGAYSNKPFRLELA